MGRGSGGNRRLPATTTVRRSVGALLVSLSGVAVAVAGPDVQGAFAAPVRPHHGTWVASEAPLPANASTGNPSVSIDALACLNARSCEAVGQYFDTGDDGQGLIETLSGNSWSATEAPLPANAGTSTNASLDAVACPSPGACVAVGQYRDTTGDTQGFMATLSSGSWAAMEAPSPADARTTFPSAHLWTLACPTVRFCVATGSYIDSNSDNETVVETRADGRWTAAELPVPADASADPDIGLSRLLCLRPHSCIAVGGYSDSGGNLEGVVETLGRGVWVPTALPLPADAASTNLLAFFYGLSCRTVRSCLAVGDYTDDTTHLHTEYEGTIDASVNGRWTATEAPLPANASTTDPQSVHLYTLSCRGTHSCVAAGTYYVDGQGQQGLVETQSDGRWTPTEAPLPVNAATTYTDTVVDLLTCRTVRSCVASGGYNGTSGSGILIETMSRHTWTPTEVPLPGNAASAFGTPQLNALACPSERSCIALGQYADTSDHGQGLLETLSDSR